MTLGEHSSFKVKDNNNNVNNNVNNNNNNYQLLSHTIITNQKTKFSKFKPLHI